MIGKRARKRVDGGPATSGTREQPDVDRAISVLAHFHRKDLLQRCEKSIEVIQAEPAADAKRTCRRIRGEGTAVIAAEPCKRVAQQYLAKNDLPLAPCQRVGKLVSGQIDHPLTACT